MALLDLFNDVGTCAAFGFIVVYALITIAAPVYLRSLDALRLRDKLGCAASLLLLVIPAVGSVYPVPAAPVSYFPYAFVAYLAVGIIWVLSFHRRQPSASNRIRQDLDAIHGRFTTLGSMSAE